MILIYFLDASNSSGSGINFDFFCLNDELYYKRKNTPYFLSKNRNLIKKSIYSVKRLKRVGGNLYVS